MCSCHFHHFRTWFYTFLSLDSGCGKGRQEAKLLFWHFTKSRCSQYSSISIPLTEPLTCLARRMAPKTLLLLWKVLVRRVVLIVLANCKAATVKTRLPRVKGNCLVHVTHNLASFSASLCLLKETGEVVINYWKCLTFLSCSLCVNFSLPDASFYGALKNSEWKFDSNVCWLHYKQRTAIFA